MKNAEELKQDLKDLLYEFYNDDYDDILERLESYARETSIEFAIFSQDWTFLHLIKEQQREAFTELYNDWSPEYTKHKEG